MSMIGDAFTAVRRLMLMDTEIERMKTTLTAQDAKLGDHERRLIWIEALIEYSRQPRLPE